MNTDRIKAQIKKAIAKMPTSIKLMRYTKIDDGAGGYTLATEPIEVKTFDALLDNSKQSSYNFLLADGGTVTRNKSPKLILVHDETFVVMTDDYFVVGGTTYKVVNPVNILHMDVYWECELEVVG